MIGASSAYVPPLLDARPPLGALTAAIVATQTCAWSEAIALWQDQFRLRRLAEPAARCIAAAALQAGRYGLADHMIGQMAIVDAALEQLIDVNAPIREARKPWFDSQPANAPDRVDRSALNAMLDLKLYRAVLTCALRHGALGEPEQHGYAIRALHGLGEHRRVVAIVRLGKLDPVDLAIAEAVRESASKLAARQMPFSVHLANFRKQCGAGNSTGALDFLGPSEPE